MGTTAEWEKWVLFNLIEYDYYMTDNLLIAVHGLASRVLMSFSVDVTLLPR